MSADPPAGYLTRPEASKRYNRSQRALERELDGALAQQDAKQLIHWKLVTKDGQIRDGGTVTSEAVKELVAEGMNPAWYVSESYLVETYGFRGTSKPEKQPQVAPTTTGSDCWKPPSGQLAEDSQKSHTPEFRSDDVEYLKERIRQLEREKQQEIERHDKIVSRLFEQLAVKDKQISAWDDVTQNITKGLATGQLQPRLPGAEATPTKSQEREDPDTKPESGAEVIEVETAPKKRTQTRTAAKPKKKSAAKKKAARPKAKQPTNNTMKQPTKPSAKTKSNKAAKTTVWDELPTFARLFGRRK
ncbi:hypothetical protein Mal52_13270 [Symmachiella dynata]|uniref:Uncharacterized protein n=1 Tax=Symmachiella dynata TaxID=2527995 RepID=A0A517ZK62_9PLAN|nr:hypothetical protein [Symmachiella dynata]QDU42858.1 hypothetical protein Mal52_13270 [Symmachiella dynata]